MKERDGLETLKKRVIRFAKLMRDEQKSRFNDHQVREHSCTRIVVAVAVLSAVCEGVERAISVVGNARKRRIF